MAKHLVSMERKPSEDREGISPLSSDTFFPISIFLSDAEVVKLGLGSASVGDELAFEAVVKVTSVSVDEHEGSDKTTSVTLTVHEAAVGATAKEQTAAEKLFGGG